MRIPTIKVEDGKGGYIVINAIDYDPSRHKALSGQSDIEIPEPEPERWGIAANMDGEIVYWTGDEFVDDSAKARPYSSDDSAESAASRTNAIKAMVANGDITEVSPTRLSS